MIKLMIRAVWFFYIIVLWVLLESLGDFILKIAKLVENYLDEEAEK